ncbi:DMT family transporter [Pseudidiomarina homiensis]|uniref:EamA family transporter n=1 Tax=Pseudidiomarina homiensis TaxID=364198 RepID=A0A432Y3A6_9GAMM|nr:DMT family transporter [Pseudidiomarina homiensis]RUO55450.1 EamA family transporter [Pseudidiomarina homiensis]
MNQGVKVLLTLLALCAFAGNSVLCRWALAEFAMEPAQFTLLRLVSGAVALAVMVFVGQQRSPRGEFERTRKASWWGALWLTAYAYCFAYAYVGLATGVGALILFTAVQLSMLAIGAWRGTRYGVIEIVGIVLALAGFLYLVWPQFAEPFTAFAVVLMSLAGTAWGAYSTVGRGSRAPLSDTKTHFVRASWLSSPLLVMGFVYSNLLWPPVLLAVLSGVVTSAIGYALWFKVLPHLRVSSAAVGQLSVPLIAALGGFFLVDETLSLRFFIASAVTLGGIALVISHRTQSK